MVHPVEGTCERGEPRRPCPGTEEAQDVRFEVARLARWLGCARSLRRDDQVPTVRIAHEEPALEALAHDRARGSGALVRPLEVVDADPYDEGMRLPDVRRRLAVVVVVHREASAVGLEPDRVVLRLVHVETEDVFAEGGHLWPRRGEGEDVAKVLHGRRERGVPQDNTALTPTTCADRPCGRAARFPRARV